MSALDEVAEHLQQYGVSLEAVPRPLDMQLHDGMVDIARASAGALYQHYAVVFAPPNDISDALSRQQQSADPCS